MKYPTASSRGRPSIVRRRSPLAGVLGLLLAAALGAAPATGIAARPQAPQFTSPAQNGPAAVSQPVTTPRIQLAILLDTSNSMDGLIDQARNQLWQVVNELAGARRDGVTPILEIALFEYGNSANARAAGYVRRVNGFTRELDAISQGLFALTTNGGDEYCGSAIDTALRDLQWSQAQSDIRIIFIAGNESFAQGPTPYQEAVRRARQQGISINTIHAGSHETGVSDGWQAAALLAGGEYLSIDADQRVAHIEAPQDARIAELNARLNQTYLPYGSAGAEKARRQQEQDRMSSEIAVGLLAKRALAKASGFYANSDWDMVDAFRDGAVGAGELEEMEDAALPEPMRGMSAPQKLDYLRQKQAERESISQQILELSESRAAYVAGQQRARAAAAPSVGDALGGAIRKQAAQKNFSLAD